MRSRVIAIIILIVLIGIPSYLYWYYYKSKISSLIFLSSSKESYTISLEGTLKYTYFPLLDTAFKYRSTCTGSCIFTPIPPLTYHIKISTLGREDIEDTIELHTGEEKKYSVILPQQLSLKMRETYPQTRHPFLKEGYKSIGINQKGKTIAVEINKINGEVGIINNERFIGLFRAQGNLKDSYLDESRRFIIIPDTSEKYAMYPLDGAHVGELFTTNEKITFASFFKGKWKVRTEKHLYEGIDGEWKINQNYTDFLDYTPRYKILYLSKNEGEKLQGLNFPTSSSLLVLFDQESNKYTVLKKDMEIQGFFFDEETPLLMDKNGNIFQLELSGLDSK